MIRRVNDAYESAKQLRQSASTAGMYDSSSSTYRSGYDSSHSRHGPGQGSYSSAGSASRAQAQGPHFTAASSARFRHKPSLFPALLGGCVFVSVLTISGLAMSRPDSASFTGSVGKVPLAHHIQDGQNGSVRYEADEDSDRAARQAALGLGESGTNVQPQGSEGRRRYGKK